MEYECQLCDECSLPSNTTETSWFHLVIDSTHAVIKYGVYLCNKNEKICCVNITCPFLHENSTEKPMFSFGSLKENSYRYYDMDYYNLSCYCCTGRSCTPQYQGTKRVTHTPGIYDCFRYPQCEASDAVIWCNSTFIPNKQSTRSYSTASTTTIWFKSIVFLYFFLRF